MNLIDSVKELRKLATRGDALIATPNRGFFDLSELLDILSEIRPGDEDHIYNVISLANMCNNGSLSEPPEFDEDDLDCLRRYAVIAERMEAESK